MYNILNLTNQILPYLRYNDITSTTILSTLLMSHRPGQSYATFQSWLNRCWSKYKWRYLQTLLVNKLIVGERLLRERPLHKRWTFKKKSAFHASNFFFAAWAGAKYKYTLFTIVTENSVLWISLKYSCSTRLLDCRHEGKNRTASHWSAPYTYIYNIHIHLLYVYAVWMSS